MHHVLCATGARRALGRILFCLLPALLVLAAARPAHAYPWMIKHGYVGCATCHADPSGGELLTKYGRMQGELLLRMRWGKDDVSAAASKPAESASSFDSFDSFGTEDEPGPSRAPERSPAKAEPEKPEPAESAPRTGFLWGLWDTPDELLLGGSVRVAAMSSGERGRVFPMQLDLYGQLALWRIRAGGSIGAAKVKQNSPNARTAFVTTNQGNQLNLVSRTHWLGVDLGAQNEWTVRAGRLPLPFGVRIPEHTMWARDATRTDRDSDQQHGLAVAHSGRILRGEIMGIAGNYQVNPDRYRERGYSGYFEATVTDGLALGASSLVTVAKADRVSLEQEKTTRGAHGPFTRVRVAEPFVILAEGDLLHTSRRELGYVGFAQGDWEITQGLHLMGTAEVLDYGYRKPVVPGFDVPRYPGVGKPAFGGWLSVDWFFLPELELRVDLIGRQNAGGTALAQLHAYL
jgi:hypothetical protein